MLDDTFIVFPPSDYVPISVTNYFPSCEHQNCKIFGSHRAFQFRFVYLDTLVLRQGNIAIKCKYTRPHVHFDKKIDIQPFNLRLRGGRFLHEDVEVDDSGDRSMTEQVNNNTVEQDNECLTADVDKESDDDEQDIEISILENGSANDYPGEPDFPCDGDLVSIQLELWANDQQILDQQSAVNFMRQYNSNPEPDASPALSPAELN